jgi:hypothetical protein
LICVGNVTIGAVAALATAAFGAASGEGSAMTLMPGASGASVPATPDAGALVALPGGDDAPSRTVADFATVFGSFKAAGASPRAGAEVLAAVVAAGS